MKTPILSDLTCHANVHSYVMQVLSTEVSPNRFQEQPPHKKYSPILYSWRITVLFFEGLLVAKLAKDIASAASRSPRIVVSGIPSVESIHGSFTKVTTTSIGPKDLDTFVGLRGELGRWDVWNEKLEFQC